MMVRSRRGAVKIETARAELVRRGLRCETYGAGRWVLRGGLVVGEVLGVAILAPSFFVARAGRRWRVAIVPISGPEQEFLAHSLAQVLELVLRAFELPASG